MGSLVIKKSFCSMLSFLVIFTLLNNFGQTQGFSTDAPSSLVGKNTSEVGSTRDARTSVVSGGLFSLVTFENTPCNATNGDLGTCYSARECTNMGGTNMGSCAGNYGVCCSVQVTCGGTVTGNNTYFVNPGYPNGATGPLTCTITVNRLTNAQWLYFDFITFDIRPPTGGCTNDTFSVTTSSSTSKNPAVCGVNSGQDEYINWATIGGRSFEKGFFRVARQTLPSVATISFTLASGTEPRYWKIRIVQFKATDACAPPTGCNQYIRNTTGTIESLNYKDGQGEIVSSGSCFTQCFQLPTGYCSVLLSSTCSNNCQFMVPGTAPQTCTTDYLTVNQMNYCGETLGTSGTLTATRVGSMTYVPVSFCTGTSNPNMDVGYRLMYTLQRC